MPRASEEKVGEIRQGRRKEYPDATASATGWEVSTSSTPFLDVLTATYLFSPRSVLFSHQKMTISVY